MSTPAVILGVPLDALTMDETVERIDLLVRRGRNDESTHQVVTVNVDFVVNALEEPSLMHILQGAALSLADGMPLIWLAQLLGTPLPGRIAGADLVPECAAASAEHGWKVHLLGGAPGVADRARSQMLALHPNASITSDGGPAAVDVTSIDVELAERIRAVDADVLLVALGNPKQERFIATYRDAVRCPVMIGIGGSLDLLVGDKKRAPTWVQRAGAEWLVRAAQEPRRLGRRYAHDLRSFAPPALTYLRRARHHRRRAEHDDHVRSWFLGDAGDPVEFDFSGIESLDPTTHALVIGAVRRGRLADHPVVVGGVGPALRECFEDYGTWSLVSTMSRRP